MKKFHLQIVTPVGMAYEGEVRSLSLRGTEGEIAIMAGHVPLVTILAPGTCRIYTEDGESWLATYESGALAVTRTGVFVALTEMPVRE